MYNKRGLSAIITTLILIALVISAIAIIWVVVHNLIKKNISSTESCADVLGKVEITNRYTYYDSNSDKLQFSINLKNIDVDKVLVSISESGEIKSFAITNEKQQIANLANYGSTGFGTDQIKLPEKNVCLSYVTNAFTNKPDSITISPIINGHQCGVCDSLFKINLGEINIGGCIPNCTGKECGSDGCEGSCGTCVDLYEEGWYCESGTCVEGVNPCRLTSALWSHTEVVEGTEVTLNVQGTNCGDIDLNYSIYEDDIIGADFVTSFVTASLNPTWISQWMEDASGDPEYYFVVSVVDNPSEYIRSSDPLLTVTQAATCVELGGTICFANETCSGSWLNASDSERCCSGECNETCIPETCLSLGKECGAWNDNCGGTLNCGTCNSTSDCVNGVCKFNATKFIINLGAVSWWKFEGNAQDEIGGNHGSVNGATLTLGKFGQAYEFDGSNDYVDVGSASSLDVNAVTVMFWAYIYDDPNDAWNRIIAAPSSFTKKYLITYPTDSSGGSNKRCIIASFGTDGLSPLQTPAESFPRNSWNHVVMTHDGSNMKIYINGQSQSLSTPSYELGIAAGNVLIGKRQDNICFTPGIIDEVAIFNQALSQEEITALYGLDLS
ncbi:hypothetical protein KAT80_00870 [Candidatus Pacearchaeota archaeon]|nr:hypothetical protein [Candidatus Pacearchaeota archaeon]